MRVAMFTPIPPARSGISAYSVALLPWLTQQHRVDLFTDDQPRDGDDALRGAAPVFSAHDIIWRHTHDPYDLMIYQLGNSTVHDYMWPYLTRYPGLVVLHDGNLHHARGAWYLLRGEVDAYRAEFAYNEPDSAAVAELGAAGLLGALMYRWPMLGTPITAARAVAVHNPWLAEWHHKRYPGALIDVVRPGMDDPLPEATAEARAVLRTRLGLAPEAVVFGAFGEVTPQKRIRQVIRAMAGIAAVVPQAHLLLVGREVDSYDIRGDVQVAGIASRTTIAGYVEDADVPRYLAATDVCLCLRWPTARETSATWLRAMAAGKTCIITDLAHNQNVPVLLTPAAWTRSHPRAPGGAAEMPDPVAVAIDVYDEEQSLPIAMQALALDSDLRRRLGAAARAYWAANFQMEHSAADYERVIRDAVARPALRASLPPHINNDGGRRARDLLEPFGVMPDILRGTRRRVMDTSR